MQRGFGRARRRLRQGVYRAGFAGYVELRAVFPLSSAGPRFLAISVEDSVAALVVDNGGMYMAGFARDAAVFSLVVDRCGQAREWPRSSSTSAVAYSRLSW